MQVENRDRIDPLDVLYAPLSLKNRYAWAKRLRDEDRDRFAKAPHWERSRWFREMVRMADVMSQLEERMEP